MARFGDPTHEPFRMAGMKKALASPKTPPHLRPHLARALGGPMNKQFAPKPRPAMNDMDGDETINAKPMILTKPNQKPVAPQAGPAREVKSKVKKQSKPKSFLMGY